MCTDFGTNFVYQFSTYLLQLIFVIYATYYIGQNTCQFVVSVTTTEETQKLLADNRAFLFDNKLQVGKRRLGVISRFLLLFTDKKRA